MSIYVYVENAHKFAICNVVNKYNHTIEAFEDFCSNIYLLTEIRKSKYMYTFYQTYTQTFFF